MDMNSGSMDEMLACGDVQLANSLFTEAVETFERIIERDPTHATAWNNRGVALIGLGRYTDALHSFNRVLDILQNDDSEGNTRSGSADQDTPGAGADETGDSDSSFASLPGKLPDDADTWYNHGIALSKLGRYTEAIASFDNALALDPDDPDTWGNRGDTCGALGKHEEAVRSYDRVLAIDPLDAGIWTSRGLSLAALGRLDEALESFADALALDPEDLDAWIGRAVILHEHEDYTGAVHAYDMALSIDPAIFDLWYKRGRALAESGHFNEAVRSFQQVLALEPGHTDAEDALQVLVLEQNRK